MNDEWRIVLYPLGLIAQLAFMGRFIIQWLQSERYQKSFVPSSFWHLSLVGNILLMIHSFFQMQYPICLVQTCNAIISWRNLNLMQEGKKKITFRSVLLLFAGASSFITFAFIAQGVLLSNGHIEWMRTPVTGWTAQVEVAPFWHLLGSLGIFLFSARFGVQWWYAEQNKTSSLNRTFWWLSLAGALLSLVYFIRIKDIVNILGPGLGLIPYVRNLMLLQKERKNLHVELLQ